MNKNKEWSLKGHSNPCMKCGSVDCAVCGKDIETLREKLIEDITSLSTPFEEGKAKRENLIIKEIACEIINRRFGVDV